MNALAGPRNCASSADRKPASASGPNLSSRTTKEGTFSLQPLKRREANRNTRGTVRKPAAIDRQKAKYLHPCGTPLEMAHEAPAKATKQRNQNRYGAPRNGGGTIRSITRQWVQSSATTASCDG